MIAKRKAFSLIMGILAALLIFAPSANVSAGQPAAVPAHSLNKEGSGPEAFLVKMVPAAAFHSDGFLPFNDTFFYFLGGNIQGTSNEYGCVETGVVLPDNVYIAEIFASIYDNDAAFDHHINLYRKARTTGEVINMASLNSSGASTTIQSLVDYDIYYSITSNPEYAYYITDCLTSPDIRLYSVRIWYETDYDVYLDEDAYLPAIRR